MSLISSISAADLPTSVRYVKNGRRGQWWPVAKANGQVHVGWKIVPKALLQKPDFREIEKVIKAEFGSRKGATQDFNALRDLLDCPSKHLWITFEDGCMWWCTVVDGATVNPEGESPAKGNFWLRCDQPWSNCSITGKRLARSDLPGIVTTTAGFQGTVCTPKGWEAILRIVRDEKDPDAVKSFQARREYEKAIQRLITSLSWHDFEDLIDLVLARTGWAHVSTKDRTREGVDVEAENPAVGEIAFVQVKSSASQETLNDYVERFIQRRDVYARMIFAVHSPNGKLVPPFGVQGVQVWTCDRVAQLAVRLGLGEWIESRLA